AASSSQKLSRGGSSVRSHPVVRFLIAGAVASAVLAALPAAFGAAPAPSGYRSAAGEHLGPGLERVALVSKSPTEAVNVARLTPTSGFELRAEPANGGVGRGLERTSSICARVHCAVAIN